MLRAPGAAEAYVGSAMVGVSSSLDVHAGSSLGVSTGVLSVSVEGGIEAVSGAEVGLRSESAERGGVVVDVGVDAGRGDACIGRRGGLRVGGRERVGGRHVAALGRRALGVVGVGGAVVSGGRVVAEAGEGMAVSAGEDDERMRRAR